MIFQLKLQNAAAELESTWKWVHCVLPTTVCYFVIGLSLLRQRRFAQNPQKYRRYWSLWIWSPKYRWCINCSL